MDFLPIGIILFILLIVLLVLQRRFETNEANKFYEELNVGDIYDYISDGNIFIQPVEVLTILDKKAGYVKYSLEIRKTGELLEKSCSGREFFDKVCYFGLMKRENTLKNDPPQKP